MFGGDREVAELLFEKGEKAYRKSDYEKAGKGPEALAAFLKCRDQLNALEDPTHKQRRLLRTVTKAVKRVGEGYEVLADLDRDFVRDCIAFGKRYLKSSPEWAKRALESADLIEPNNESVNEYLDRLADIDDPSEGTTTR